MYILCEPHHEKTCLWGCNQLSLKIACSATETSWGLEISAIGSRGNILSRQRTTKVLIRLRWSAPLLFAYGINRFSHDVVHIKLLIGQTAQMRRLVWTFVVHLWDDLGFVIMWLIYFNFKKLSKNRSWPEWAMTLIDCSQWHIFVRFWPACCEYTGSWVAFAANSLSVRKWFTKLSESWSHWLNFLMMYFYVSVVGYSIRLGLVSAQCWCCFFLVNISAEVGHIDITSAPNLICPEIEWCSYAGYDCCNDLKYSDIHIWANNEDPV